MRETKSVRHEFASWNNAMVERKGEDQVLGEEKCDVYRGQGRTFKLPASLSRHYRAHSIEAWQLLEVNMSTLSSNGFVADSAGSASSLQPAEHHQVQEPVHYQSG